MLQCHRVFLEIDNKNSMLKLFICLQKYSFFHRLLKFSIGLICQGSHYDYFQYYNDGKNTKIKQFIYRLWTVYQSQWLWRWKMDFGVVSSNHTSGIGDISWPIGRWSLSPVMQSLSEKDLCNCIYTTALAQHRPNLSWPKKYCVPLWFKNIHLEAQKI